MKDIKTFIIGFLTCACLFLIMGQMPTMDDEQIFYLGTRCLSYSEAERIIVEGFLEPLSRTMSHQVRAWISNIIESKWAN